MNCPHCNAYIDEHKAEECLSWWVSEVIFGVSKRKPTHGNCCTCQSCGQAHDECICYYAFNMEDAWRIVEKMRQEKYYGSVNITMWETLPWNVRFWSDFEEKKGYDSSDSVALSICRAAIKAQGYDKT